ncbi:MAG: hypothetical protein ABFS39_02180 [Pseudomonadota bacterium]
MKLKEKNGILYPAKMKFDSWIVVGPPGAGKSYLMNKISGYPGEVAIDISQKKWWAVEPLTHRPREIHLVFPFKGFDEGLSVYDDKFKELSELPELDLERILIPQKKKFILAPNWQARFVFDFILPPPNWLYETRKKRLSSEDKRLVDLDLTLEWISWQLHIHWRVAWFFHQGGLQVMLRPFNTARPYSFPVLEKILQKKTKHSNKKVSPDLDWSKVQYVKLWFDQSSPKPWKNQQWDSASN